MTTNQCPPPPTPQNFIAWKPDFDSPVRLINCQHREILLFVNGWHADLKFSRLKGCDILGYLRRRLDFLAHYTRHHLAFEEDMLLLMERRHGFPEQDYQKHVQSHLDFTRSFMDPLAGQIDLFAASHAEHMADNILVDMLRDVAAWWYSHIRTPDGGKPGGPDHVYREFLRSRPAAAQVELLNDLLMVAELSV